MVEDEYRMNNNKKQIESITLHMMNGLKIIKTKHLGAGTVVKYNVPTCQRCDGHSITCNFFYSPKAFEFEIKDHIYI